MRRAAPVLHLLTTLLVTASTVAGGWIAMCAGSGAVMHAHLSAAHTHVMAAHAHIAAAHRMVYSAVHHHHAPSRPPPPPLPDDWKECLSMGMAGASCFGAANAAALELAALLTAGSGDRYPPAAEVRDRLPNDLPFDPPRA